jgi:hypothetical protein
MKEPLAQRFCRCIKKVQKTRKASTRKESAAIAICVKSVLQSRGITLRKFRCKEGAKLETQKIKKNIK